MADIEQKMNFDASQAIAQIALLNTALEGLNALLGSTGTTVSNWNAVGGAAVTQFTSMKTAAEAARKAIEALNNAQQKASEGASKIASSPVNQVAAPSPVDMSNYVAQIETMGKALGDIPVKASEGSKRAYASAVANLAQYASQNKVSLEAVNAAWNNNGQVVTGAGNKLANMCQTVKTAHENMAKSAGGFMASLEGAWSKMMQIAGGLILHQAIQALIGLFKEGVQEAIRFGIQVADIGVISGNAFKTTAADLQSISTTLIDASNRFGRSLQDVGTGYYRILSSQVGSASDVTQVLDKALTLSTATNTSLADSASLLTGTLNAYNLSARSAADISGVFIKTVELGRARLGDFAEIMGRVYPIAHEMGVSLEEANAAMVTMTNAGVRADTAVTQLRGIFTQLLKPTKELKDLMQHKWGVENAVEAIRVFGGFIPLIEALSKETGGANVELVAFFKNVRALTGVMGITGSGLEKMKNNLVELQGAGSSLSDWAKNFVLDTPAKQAEIAWTKFKNSFVEFGATALPVLTSLLGPIEVFILGLKTMAGWTHGPDFQKMADDFIASKTKLLEANAEIDAKLSRSNEKRINEAITANSRFFVDLKMLSAASAEELDKFSKAFVETTKQQLNSSLKTQEAIISKLESIIAGSAEKIKKINKSVADENKTYQERQWSLEKAQLEVRGSRYVTFAETQRGAQLEAQGQAKIRNATTEEEIDSGKKLLEQSRGYYESVTNSNSKLHTSRMPFQQDLDREKRLHEELNGAETKRKNLLENQKKLAETALPKQMTLLTEEKELRNQIVELVKDLNTEQAKSPEFVKRTTDALKNSMQDLKNIKAQGLAGDTDTTRKLGMQDLVGKGRVTGETVASSTLAQADTLAKRLNSTYIELKGRAAEILPNVHTLADAEKKTAALGEQVKAAEKAYKDANGSLETFIVDQQAANKVVAEASKIRSTLPATGGGTQGGGYISQDSIDRMAKINSAYKDLAQKASEAVKAMGTEDEAAKIEAFSRAVLNLNKDFAKTPEYTNALKNGVAGMVTQIEKLSKNKNKMTPEGVDEALHKYNEIKSDLEYITTEAAKMREKMQLPTSEAAAFEYYLKTGKTTLDSVGGAINTDAIKMSDLTTQTSLAADQAERLASALNQSGGAGGGAGGGDFSGDAGGGGDFQYAASGGVARRGTDTIPAMLSPGERVMNAASSRQFSSQLQSMNSGMLPVPRSQSGSVTNIGDINVSVKGGDNTHQTAREIAQVLRREIRRGTSRLN